MLYLLLAYLSLCVTNSGGMSTLGYDLSAGSSVVYYTTDSTIGLSVQLRSDDGADTTLRPPKMKFLKFHPHDTSSPGRVIDSFSSPTVPQSCDSNRVSYILTGDTSSHLVVTDLREETRDTIVSFPHRGDYRYWPRTGLVGRYVFSCRDSILAYVEWYGEPPPGVVVVSVDAGRALDTIAFIPQCSQVQFTQDHEQLLCIAKDIQVGDSLLSAVALLDIDSRRLSYPLCSKYLLVHARKRTSSSPILVLALEGESRVWNVWAIEDNSDEAVRITDVTRPSWVREFSLEGDTLHYVVVDSAGGNSDGISKSLSLSSALKAANSEGKTWERLIGPQPDCARLFGR